LENFVPENDLQLNPILLEGQRIRRFGAGSRNRDFFEHSNNGNGVAFLGGGDVGEPDAGQGRNRRCALTPQGQLLCRLHAKLDFLIRADAEATGYFDPVAASRQFASVFERFGLCAAAHDGDLATAVVQVENHASGFKNIGVARDTAGDFHIGEVHGGRDLGNPHGREFTINGIEVEQDQPGDRQYQ